MTVMVEMPSALRQFADNQDDLDSDGKNVEEVLADLCSRFPELKQNLYEDEGSIRNFINIYVNDEDIRYADGDADWAQRWGQDSDCPLHRGRL